MQWSVPLTRGTPAAYAPAAPRVAVRSLRTLGVKTTAEALMSYIKFECPYCCQRIDAPVELAGTDNPCPRCLRAIAVPRIASSSHEAPHSVRCASCGSEVEALDSFCRSCGRADPTGAAELRCAASSHRAGEHAPTEKVQRRRTTGPSAIESHSGGGARNIIGTKPVAHDMAVMPDASASVHVESQPPARRGTQPLIIGWICLAIQWIAMFNSDASSRGHILRSFSGHDFASAAGQFCGESVFAIIACIIGFTQWGREGGVPVTIAAGVTMLLVLLSS
jgi:hypothetical protein